MSRKKFWTDMHSNLHHEQITDLPHWYDHVIKIMDFWPIAYYPFYMRPTEWGLAVEDRYEDEVIKQDWEYIRDFAQEANAAGFPMFMGFEWQGSGKDGDHNVFFLDNLQEQKHPMRYEELVKAYKGINAIGIPHHLAYQLGSRGKNWGVHNEQFSPVAEIYSSHGSSENDEGPLGMKRHVHMGPRTGQTCYEVGLNQGYKVGVIAAGDNHSVPAVFEHGAMCVLAEEYTKEAIWDAILKRRTVAVSQSRIQVDFSIDEAIIGDEIMVKDQAVLSLQVEGTNAVDRIEILKDNVVEEMVVHSGTWEQNELVGKVRFKFRVEFGWGPDTRVYADCVVKQWHGQLKTEGQILSIEKCWNNFGQDLKVADDKRCEFDLTTYKSTASGKWMGPSNVTTEGFIFEIEDDIDHTVQLIVDGAEYLLPIRELLQSSQIIPLQEKVEELTLERWGEVNHYRDDPWWHNAYKIKIGRAAPASAFCVAYTKNITVDENCNYRLRVWQMNGDVAWTSPIFLVKER